MKEEEFNLLKERANREMPGLISVINKETSLASSILIATKSGKLIAHGKKEEEDISDDKKQLLAICKTLGNTGEFIGKLIKGIYGKEGAAFHIKGRCRTGEYHGLGIVLIYFFKSLKSKEGVYIMVKGNEGLDKKEKVDEIYKWLAVGFQYLLERTQGV